MRQVFKMRIEESMDNRSILSYYNYARVTEILNKTAKWF